MLCTRKFEFDSAHRVLGHESKCRFLHGHRYVAEIQCYAESLDKLGFCIDFADIKRIIGQWIDLNWDHNILLNSNDPLLALSEEERASIFGDKHPWILQNCNPTAEAMAEYLLTVADTILRDHRYPVRVTAVRLYETPNCWSDFQNPYFHPQA